MDDVTCKNCDHSPTQHESRKMFGMERDPLLFGQCRVPLCRCEKFEPTWVERTMR